MIAAVVYALCSRINGKIYVGKTIQLEERLQQHQRDARIDLNRYLANAIRKYGWNDFIVVILAQGVTEKEAFQLEKEWIANLDSQNPENGYNLTEGGDGIIDPTGAIGRKRSKTMTGRKQVGERLKQTRIHVEKMSQLAYTVTRGRKLTGRRLEQTQIAQTKAVESCRRKYLVRLWSDAT
jgi:group I intron endonuclease